jgi:hypothetical protein
MYCAVGQLQTRYVAAFLAITVAEALFVLSAGVPEAVRSAVFIALGITVLGQPLKSSIRQARMSMNPASLPFSRLHSASNDLHEAGIPPGSSVAVLASGIDFDANLIARSSGFRITTQIFDPPRYWGAGEAKRRDMIALLRGAGVRAILTSGPVSPDNAGEGWRHIDGTPAFLLPIASPNLQEHQPAEPDHIVK